MNSYRYEVVVTYSTVITVDAETLDKAKTIAEGSTPKWIDIGAEMAYVEDLNVYEMGDK